MAKNKKEGLRRAEKGYPLLSNKEMNKLITDYLASTDKLIKMALEEKNPLLRRKKFTSLSFP